MTTGTATIRCHHDINEVDAEAWDALARPAGPLFSHRFLRVCQESGVEGARYWHLLLQVGGSSMGAVSLSSMTVSLDLLAPRTVRLAAGAMRAVWPGCLRVPVLLCGIPVSLGQASMSFREGAQEAELANAVVDFMESLARKEGFALLCFKEFDPASASRLSNLERRGFFRAQSLPACFLDLPWADFSEYLGSLRSGYRRQIRGTLNARKTHGLTARVREGLGDDLDLVYALYRQVLDRAPHRLEILNPAFFAKLDEHYGESLRTVFLEREGRTLAVAILLEEDRTIRFLWTGLDYAAARRLQVYENLGIEVVALALAEGAERLELGQTSYEFKSRLGARTEERFLYLRHTNRIAHGVLRRASRFLFPPVTFPTRTVFHR